MAPKTQTRLVDQPPSASSSEDGEESDPEEQSLNSEEDSEEEEEEDEEEEDEEEQAPTNATEQIPKTTPEQAPTIVPEQAPKTAPAAKKPQSSSGSESDSDEEGSDSSQQIQPSPSVSTFKIKPTLPSNPPPVSKPPAKRAAEAPVNDSGKKRSKSGEKDINAEGQKLPGSASAAFVKVWSDEDEITVLVGLKEFKDEKGVDPHADMSAFHEFIKGKLHADVSKTQMYEKIRRLKKKFLNNIKKGDKIDFAKPHDYKTFDLSKLVWGSSAVSNGVTDNVKGKKAAEGKKKSSDPKKVAKVSNLYAIVSKEENDELVPEKEEEDFKSKYPRLVESFNKRNMPKLSQEALIMMKENMSLIGSSKAKELEEKWTQLLKEEAELYLIMTQLMGEQVKLIMDAIKR